MNWKPKDWRRPPRLAKAFGWLRRTIARALVDARKALLNIDRRTFRRIWARLKVYVSSYYFMALIVLAVLTAPLWFDLLLTVRANLVDLLDRGPATDKDGALDIRGHYFAIGILITALAALFTAPLALLKAYINERQTKTAEQGLITEQITKAVEQLGAEKTVKRREREIKYRLSDDLKRSRLHRTTEIEGEEFKLPEGAEIRDKGDWQSYERSVPNLEVRLGGIYALERIAQDSQRDYSVIIEILCAYVRSNSPASSAVKIDIDDGTALWAIRDEIKHQLDEIKVPRIDIEAAIEVIGRRNILFDKRARKRIDLRNCNLQKINIQRLNLEGAMISGSYLDGANIIGCNLKQVIGTPSNIYKKISSDGSFAANTKGQVSLLRSTIIDTSMKNATLIGCKFDTSLIRNSNMSGSNFFAASFMLVDFDEVDISESTIGCADLTNSSGLDEVALRKTLGDRGTRCSLKDSLPPHWHKYGVPFADEDQWRAWLAAGAPTDHPPQDSPGRDA